MLKDEQIVVTELEKRKSSIVQEIAEKLLREQVEPYASFPINQIIQVVTPSVEAVLDYFRTDDSSTLKASINARVADRVKRGFALDGIQRAIEIIAETLEQAIKVITNEEKTSENVLAKYRSRVESIKVLSKVSAITRKLKESN